MMLEHPTSLQQESRLRSLDRYGSPAPTTACWSLTGRLDPAALARAVRVVVDRSDALRTRFPGLSPVRCSLLAPEEVGELVTLEVPRGADLDPREYLRRELLRPFDLERGPLARFCLVRLDAADWLFGVAVDHLGWDQVSVSTFLRELATAYSWAVTGASGPPPLPPPVSYVRLSALQRTMLAGPWGQRRRQFWQANFARWGCYPPSCPLGNVTPEVAVGSRQSSTTVCHPLDGAALAGLNSLRRSCRATNFAVLAAIVLGVVGELSGCAQVGFVTDLHGRVVPGSASAIGLFSHGVPVHLDVAGHRALPERISKIRGEVLDLLDFGLPLRQFSSQLRAAQRDRPGPPDTGATMLYFAVDEDSRFTHCALPGMTATRVALYAAGTAQPGRSSEMLAVEVAAAAEVPEIQAQFDASVFPARDVHALVEGVVRVLARHAA